MRAIWNGQILAESEDTVVIENNHYFPPEAINKEFFVKSDSKSVCPWKGEASYYTIKVNGEENVDAAWFYPEVSELARSIKGRVAFWKGVEVTK